MDKVQVNNPSSTLQTWGIPGAGRGNIRLSPGMNQLEVESAKLLLKHPVFKQYLEKGLVHVDASFLMQCEDDDQERLDNINTREQGKQRGRPKAVAQEIDEKEEVKEEVKEEKHKHHFKG